ncbi:MAG: tetratricopeptide repeat protein [Spirochaetia bacterium]|jgi:tetratricopeptide (TPR) repeat protein
MQAFQQQAGQGQQAPPVPIRRRISSFLAHAVSRFRIALLVVLIAAAALLVGYVVYNEISNKLIADSTLMAERAQTQFDSWQSESDATKKAALEKDLFDQLGTLISRYPRQYGGQRGLFIRADANFEKKAWDAGLKDYETLAARFPKSYLAPISLFNAAVCYEEKGDTDNALKLYVQASGSYKDSTVAPRALFDSGRLYEAKSDWANAQKAYQSMDGLYAQSMWTRLAKNRLVELKVQGKIK